MFNTTLIDIHTKCNEDMHHLIQENRKLQHDVASLHVKLHEQRRVQSLLRQYVNDKLAVHHHYHPTDLPWFWQGFNSQDPSGLQVLI
jgi:hypothetical protein